MSTTFSLIQIRLINLQFFTSTKPTTRIAILFDKQISFLSQTSCMPTFMGDFFELVISP